MGWLVGIGDSFAELPHHSVTSQGLHILPLEWDGVKEDWNSGWTCAGTVLEPRWTHVGTVLEPCLGTPN